MLCSVLLPGSDRVWVSVPRRVGQPMAEAAGGVCREEAVSLTRPEGTPFWSGLRREPGPLGAAGLCGSSRAWGPQAAERRKRGPGLHCGQAGRGEKAKGVEGPVF